MRIKDFESSVVSALCLNVMESKALNGEALPITDNIKYSPNRSDLVNTNGVLSPPTTPSSATTPVDNDYSQSTNSGRFKFFKDGKFVLELWHHRNGERMYWIPVSKNSTYWPPTGNCVSSRQESSTSLSMSDDNLSIQSSPWQRDHTWKQNIPRKNINQELAFMYVVRRPKKHYTSISIKKKRRRPYDLIKIEEEAAEKNNYCETTITKTNNTKKKIRQLDSRKTTTTKKIGDLIGRIWERKSFYETSSSRIVETTPGIVSPRKRILKEMEKVTLDEIAGGNQSSNKKHRAKTIVSAPASTSTTVVVSSLVKPVSSHSINSILSRGGDEEPSVLRNLLKSPMSVENNQITDCLNGSSQHGSPDSPSSSVLNLPPPRSSTPNSVISSSLNSSPSFSPAANVPCQPVPSYLPPHAFIYHHSTAHPYLSPTSNHTPSYYHGIPPNYHTSQPAVWGLRSVSSLPSPAALYSVPNPSPWIPLAHSSFQGYSTVADVGTDVPLNLSKHPG